MTQDYKLLHIQGDPDHLVRVPTPILSRVQEALHEAGLEWDYPEIRDVYTVEGVLDLVGILPPDDECFHCRGTGIGDPHRQTNCPVCGGLGQKKRVR